MSSENVAPPVPPSPSERTRAQKVKNIKTNGMLHQINEKLQVQWVNAWYTFFITILYAMRFQIYHREKMHYFLIDFCYFINFLLLFHIHLYPHSELLFQICFVLSTGPIAFAVVTWRNSLVFHSLDKMTSGVIHLFPPLVVFCLRWFPETSSNQLAAPPTITWTQFYFLPFSVYLYWQICYSLKTGLVDCNRMREQKDLWTSARWFSRHSTSTGIINKIINYGGQDEWDMKINRNLIIGQILYTGLVLLPMGLLYENMTLNIVYLLFVFLAWIHNGSGYYIHVFSRRDHDMLLMKFVHMPSDKLHPYGRCLCTLHEGDEQYWQEVQESARGGVVFGN